MHYEVAPSRRLSGTLGGQQTTSPKRISEYVAFLDWYTDSV